MFKGWRPPGVEIISKGWAHAKENGLRYILFSAVLRVDERVMIVECQCDPCDDAAQVAYREMVHDDLAKEISKALGSDKQAARAGAAPPV